MNLTGGNGFIGVEIDNASLQGLLRDLKGYGREAEKAIDTAVKQTSLAIQTDAKNRLRGNLGANSAPSMPKMNIKTRQQSGFGNLLRSVYNRGVKSMEWVVGSNLKYAAYIEFGTGEKVFTNFDFDDAARKVAAQFKGKKKIAGIRGESFLNWAAVNQEKRHIERIEKELNRINK